MRPLSRSTADGHVYDSVKLHNSRARMRGCPGTEDEAGEQGSGSCGRGFCPPWMQAQKAQQAQQQAILHVGSSSAASAADV